MPTDLLAQAEDLWLCIAPMLPGFTVEVLPSVDSTNSELMRRARAGSMDPVLLIAQSQTAGRGRLGKQWHSHAGQSLTFSLALPLNPGNWSGLSLAVGVSLAESLHADVRIKWPNDLWLQGRKLGGILVETAHTGQGSASQRMVVIGAGINIARPSLSDVSTEALPAHGMAPVAPAGLAEVCMGQTAGETLRLLAPALVRDVQTFEAHGFAAFAERFARRDALLGLPVRLSDGTQGKACGVNASGALQVQTADGLQSVTSSEVSVRPC